MNALHFSNQEHHSLLSNLANNDQFREQFMASPQALLAKHCVNQTVNDVKLPAKESITVALELLKKLDQDSLDINGANESVFIFKDFIFRAKH